MSWDHDPDGRGYCFRCNDGRRIELYLSNGDSWAVDVVHEYGCTRLYLGDDYSEALERMDAHMRKN